MADLPNVDMFSELYRQAQDSYDARLSRAQIAGYAIAREKFLPFLKQAKTDEDIALRLDLGEATLSAVANAAAQQQSVEAGPVLSHIMERLAAEVAVTKPKTVKPDKEIGGAEGKKYLETRPRKVPEEGQPDDKTDVNELDAVVEEPKRHKLVHDQKLETQKDNKPGEGSGASGKSFPNYSSSVKTGFAMSKKDYVAIAQIIDEYGADPALVDALAAYFASDNPRFDTDRFNEAAGFERSEPRRSTKEAVYPEPFFESEGPGARPSIGSFIQFLRNNVDPNEPFDAAAADDLVNTFFAEYESAPEQVEDY